MKTSDARRNFASSATCRGGVVRCCVQHRLLESTGYQWCYSHDPAQPSQILADKSDSAVKQNLLKYVRENAKEKEVTYPLVNQTWQCNKRNIRIHQTRPSKEMIIRDFMDNPMYKNGDFMVISTRSHEFMDNHYASHPPSNMKRPHSMVPKGCRMGTFLFFSSHP